MSWRGGWMVSMLVVGAGCGGALPGEEATDAWSEEAEVAPGEGPSGAAYCPPTEAATQRVKTILPPSEIGLPRYAAVPNEFVNFQGALHFAVNFEDGHRALWKSNGLEAGTTQIKSFPATAGSFTPALSRVTPTASRLFFQAADVARGLELWVSDGTTAGTVFVKDLTPGPDSSYLTHMTAVGGDTLVFFKEATDIVTSSTRFELWKSDGTSSGTVRLRDFGTNVDVSYVDAAAGGVLRFFVREITGATSLWTTDGTASGTQQVKRLSSGPNAFPSDVRSQGALTLFLLRESTGLQELWKTNGTSGGTVRLASFGVSREVQVLGALGSSVYVTTTSTSTQFMVIYRVPLAGGNPASVVTLPNDYATLGEAFPTIDSVSIAPEGTKLFFAVNIGSGAPAPRDTQLWVTNGTAGGTTLLRRPLSLSDEYGSPVYAVADDLVFFSAFEGDVGPGIEPWVSNGTPGGTRRLKDIGVGGSSYPRDFFRVGARVFFSAYDDTEAGQLWSVALSNTCLTPESVR